MVETKQPIALRVLVVFVSISVAVIIARILSRALSRSYGWDDLLILISLGLALAQSICYYMFATLVFLGYHYYDIPIMTASRLNHAQQYSVVIQISYHVGIAFVRLSGIAFMLRLSQLPKSARIQLWAIFILSVAMSISFTFAAIFQCGGRIVYPYIFPFQPTRKRPPHCIKHSAFFITSSIINILLDIWVLYVPSVIVRGMNMRMRDKLIVVAILSLGAISTIFGIARLAVLAPFWIPKGLDLYYSSLYTFGAVELNIAIWSASAPALKVLINRLFPGFWSGIRDTPNRPPNAPDLPPIESVTASLQDETSGDERLPRSPGNRPSPSTSGPFSNKRELPGDLGDDISVEDPYKVERET